MSTIIKAFESGSAFYPTPSILVRHDDGSFEVTSAVDDIEDRQFLGLGFDNGPEFPRFTTAKAALRYERLCSEHSTISDDLDAFNAPSECNAIAYRAVDRAMRRWNDYLAARCVNVRNSYFNFDMGEQS